MLALGFELYINTGIHLQPVNCKPLISTFYSARCKYKLTYLRNNLHFEVKRIFNTFPAGTCRRKPLK